MRRGLLFIFALPVMLAGVVMAAPAALAVSAHFVSAGAAVNADGSLTVAFKEAGLGSNQLIGYEADASAAATYVCVNNGGANPSAANKTTVSGPVSAAGTFSSGKNGNVTAALTLSPPAPPPPAMFSCPKGQKGPELAQVSYTSVSLTDTTNGIPAPTPGTFSACALPNVRGACD
jgi:uncharacterized cupredoxin-like copper-binding protein